MNASPDRQLPPSGPGAPPPLPTPRASGKAHSPAWRWLGWALAAAALAAVFLAYLSPHLAVDLAGRLWSCF
jgi:hypothetical protein